MQDIIKILKKVGAVIPNGHFVGTSGRHLPAYINKDALTCHTKHTSDVGKLFAQNFKNKKIEAVVAPAVAGIPLSQWTAYHLSKILKREVLSLFTEKTDDNGQIFKRGYGTLIKGKRILIVEDITTTGSSIKKVVDAVKKSGGRIVGACVMINKDPKAVNSKNIGVPFSSLAVFKVNSYDENSCPLCKKGVPVNTKFGHGKKYLKSKTK